jgi:hypothetical protein
MKCSECNTANSPLNYLQFLSCHCFPHYVVAIYIWDMLKLILIIHLEFHECHVTQSHLYINLNSTV